MFQGNKRRDKGRFWLSFIRKTIDLAVKVTRLSCARCLLYAQICSSQSSLAGTVIAAAALPPLLLLFLAEKITVGLISSDRAPLVARLLIANSLTRIISDAQFYFGTERLQLHYRGYLVCFETTARQWEDIKT